MSTSMPGRISFRFLPFITIMHDSVFEPVCQRHKDDCSFSPEADSSQFEASSSLFPFSITRIAYNTRTMKPGGSSNERQHTQTPSPRSDDSLVGRVLLTGASAGQCRADERSRYALSSSRLGKGCRSLRDDYEGRACEWASMVPARHVVSFHGQVRA